MLRVQPTIACASPPQELKRLFAQEGPTLLTYHGTWDKALPTATH